MKKVQIFTVVVAIVTIFIYSCVNSKAQTRARVISSQENVEIFSDKNKSLKDGDTVVIEKVGDVWSVNSALDYRRIQDTTQNCGDINVIIRVAVVEIVSDSNDGL
ncbi:MAG: hypothetical protein WCK37_02500 [Candidatus Falkowbacteria bacterium]